MRSRRCGDAGPALERASRLGYLVLASRVGLAEARLPWVGLTDLLRNVAASVLAGERVLPVAVGPVTVGALFDRRRHDRAG